MRAQQMRMIFRRRIIVIRDGLYTSMVLYNALQRRATNSLFEGGNELLRASIAPGMNMTKNAHAHAAAMYVCTIHKWLCLFRRSQVHASHSIHGCIILHCTLLHNRIWILHSPNKLLSRCAMRTGYSCIPFLQSPRLPAKELSCRWCGGSSPDPNCTSDGWTCVYVWVSCVRVCARVCCWKW